MEHGKGGKLNRPSSRKVLIIGGSGFIGSHLCRRLLSQNYLPVVFYGAPPTVEGVEYHCGDMSGVADLWPALLENVEAVYHLAWTTKPQSDVAGLRRVAAYLRRYTCDIFHGWTHESLRSLKAAKQQGTITIVDRGYSHPRFSKRILDEEYAIYGVPRKLEQAPKWLMPFDHWRRELEEAVEEFDVADYVFVNSQFCYDTFVEEGYPKEKLVMIPRGFEVTQYRPLPKEDDKFRVVFVGLLCVRKGLKYLLEAWDRLQLPDAELVLVGSLHEELRPMMAPYLGRKDIVHLGFVKTMTIRRERIGQQLVDSIRMR